jgi:hypothetical protein
LDEAHNVEDTLRSLGSDTFKEFELIEMLALLNSFAVKWQPPQEAQRRKNEEDLSEKMPEIAHDLILMLEKIIRFLRECKYKFENNQVQNGVAKARVEYEKFKCPDNKEWEVMYFGPNGCGVRGEPIGCRNFFNTISFQEKDAELISSQIALFESYMTSKRGNDEGSQQRSKLADRIVKLVSGLCDAYRLSEHYYISSVVSANGNLDFATESEEIINSFSSRRFKRNPKSIIQMPSATKGGSIPPDRVCNHKTCNKESRGCISHDIFADGSTPLWESSLVVNLLTPGIGMSGLSKRARSLVFASGSLAPIPSLCAELNLLPPDPKTSKEKTSTSTSAREITSGKDINSENILDNLDIEDKSGDKNEKERKKFIDPFSVKYGRLQVTPKPLEANHVINLEKQLLSVSIGHFPDGSPLSVKMANYSKAGFHDKLGDAIATIIETIPNGGVLGK